MLEQIKLPRTALRESGDPVTTADSKRPAASFAGCPLTAGMTVELVLNGARRAADAIDSGKAHDTLDLLVAVSNA
jgi:anthranilate phosphoribosyltransferase